MDEIGKEILALQNNLAEQYKYKPLPVLIAKINMEKYVNSLPICFSGQLYKSINKPGFYINGKDLELFTCNGTKVSNKYRRIVIGHYGAFIEIEPKDMVMENIIVQPGQEYRINDPNYASRVKYYWMTVNDDSHIKLYQQMRPVTYADYEANKWYISPFEVQAKKI